MVKYKKRKIQMKLSIKNLLCLTLFSMSLMVCKGQFYAPQTNQPNCVVGAFCMYAHETLNVQLSPFNIQTNASALNKPGVEIWEILPAWNELFPSNHIHEVFHSDGENEVIYSSTEVILYDHPYLWVGYYNTNHLTTHACLVYFHTNSVMYKHFVYWPITGTNYMTTTNYTDFFSRTLRVYTLNN